MATIIRRPVLDEDGRRAGTSYIAGEIELHLPPDGRPEVYVGQETIDAGVLIVELPNLLLLFNDPMVRASILRACSTTH